MMGKQKPVRQRRDKSSVLIWLILTLACFLFWPAEIRAAQTQVGQEDPETILAQADSLYSKGEYKKAAEEYLRVINLTENRLFRSRAWMGLSLCYFFDNEIENAKNALRRLLEIDPQKEISPLFYPQTFVDLFSEIKREMATKESPALPPAAEPAIREKEAAQQKAKAAPVPGYRERRGGHFEVEVHYSGWSLNPARGVFESSLEKRAANEIRDHLTDQLRATYGSSLAPLSHSSKLSLGSEGSNYGVEIRFYPLGYRGSFSLGLSFEKTHIKIPLEGEVTQRYADGSEATVEATAHIETNPTTANLNFRWDFVPSWRVSPYFVLGFGIGPLEGEARYNYAGIYQIGSEQRKVEGGETKNFDNLREEGDIKLDMFLLLHAALGVKGEVFSGLLGKAEVGLWNGFILRVGLAFRF